MRQRTLLVSSIALASACTFADPTVRCGDLRCPATSTCSPDGNACIPRGCGNGVAAGIEECDGTDVAGETCASLGYYEGTLACSVTCQFDTSPRR